jgi:hypothetical protein
MQIINWQTIYREPKTTMSNKEHKKQPYLLKDLKISHKTGGQQISLYSYGKRVYVFNCDY